MKILWTKYLRIYKGSGDIKYHTLPRVQWYYVDKYWGFKIIRILFRKTECFISIGEDKMGFYTTIEGK